MKTENETFHIEVEDTRAVCAVGDRYSAQHAQAGDIPVLSCEGPCIRGEIVRQAAHLVGAEPGFARACSPEALTVPGSGMGRWVRESERVLVLDGCFLRCQSRIMGGVLRPEQMVAIDVMPLHRKYGDVFEIDAVPEAERLQVARDVADQVLERLVAPRTDPGAAGTCAGTSGSSAP